MRCLEAAFVILLGCVFSFRKYRSSFRKIKLFILQIIDFQFVSSSFVSKITIGPRYVRIRKKKKQDSNDDMKTTEARLHAGAGQEPWNVKEGLRLSIQQRFVVFSRSG